MSEEVDQFMAGFDRALQEELDEIGQKIVEDLQELVDVPVAFVIRDTRTGKFKSARGPRGGKRVIRSKPGEPPRKETGEYQLSFRSVTYVEGGEVILEVYTEDPRGKWFEGGTARMGKRPHFGEVFDKWAPVVASRLGIKLTS